MGPPAQRVTQRSQHGGGEVLGLLVTGLAADPTIDAGRCEQVGADRLGHRGGLAEPRSGNDHRDRRRPAQGEATDELRASQLMASGEGGLVRSCRVGCSGACAGVRSFKADGVRGTTRGYVS